MAALRVLHGVFHRHSHGHSYGTARAYEYRVNSRGTAGIRQLVGQDLHADSCGRRASQGRHPEKTPAPRISDQAPLQRPVAETSDLHNCAVGAPPPRFIEKLICDGVLSKAAAFGGVTTRWTSIIDEFPAAVSSTWPE